MPTYEEHELATLFPLIPDDELQQLADDIRDNGLQTPITLFEGKILDGRNRLRGCQRAGVEPTFSEYTGNDPEAFVISRNLNRRHLTTSQRSIIAGKLAKRKEGQGNSANLQSSTSTAEAAAQMQVSPRSVSAARKLLKEGDEETIAAVESGKKTLAAAVKALPEKPKPAAKPVKPSDKYDAALDRIERICGKPVARAIRENKLSNATGNGALFWASLTDAQMASIQELVVAKRWEPKKAHQFLTKMPGLKTRINELELLAIAGGGQVLVMTGTHATICFNTRDRQEDFKKVKRTLGLD